jgi:hypothetical protein
MRTRPQRACTSRADDGNRSPTMSAS